ncbi:MFS transporter [Flavimaricola marinus]|uniref:Major Facilitator Superfamily protein n=1 Tax=Flavimaricola marinus TaxID=1819565 RepID=A0A238LC41_9RHOB|nr:MFS transporter [Flavimaricola marinus]SMY07123.1 Major Facilitator Superfamily protein [Flavimaricola marinus]
MQNRWLILFVLFLARTAMAFQFQSVGALSPLLIDSLALSLVEVGLLIGLYLGPGIIVGMLGGAVAAWFGDKRTVIASLLLMILGSVMIAYAAGLTGLIAGRIVSGIGGVVINVVMTKLVIDWFAGASMATAMSLFISSWPLGIAASLLILPTLAGVGGLGAAWLASTAISVVALALFLLVYQAPPGAVVRVRGLKSVALPMRPLVLSSVTWGIFNTGIAMVFGFGPLVLTGRGLSATDASSITSLYMLTLTLATLFGGWIGDRLGGRDGLVLGCLVVSAILFPALIYAPVGLLPLLFGITGVLAGLIAGPIAALPSLFLAPEARAFGMGIYFSIYYGLMMAAPPIAGALAEGLGEISVAFGLGSGMMVVTLIGLLWFRQVVASAAAEQIKM